MANSTNDSPELSIALPVELLDLVCDLVESTTDLLSFALTSKCLLNLIIPNHLHFRLLRCDLTRLDIWHTLRHQPTTAALIRELDIFSEDHYFRFQVRKPPRVPPSLDFASDTTRIMRMRKGHLVSPREQVPQFQELAAAMASMTGLKTFRWRTQRRWRKELLNAVQQILPRLRELDIVFGYDPNNDATIGCMDLTNAQKWRFPNLTKFSFLEIYSYFPQETFAADSKVLSALLLACPALVDLFVFRDERCRSELPMDVPQDLFRTATWPNLRRLSTDETFLRPTHERFFTAHPNIENLCLRCHWTYSTITFAPLQRLKSLEITWMPKVDQIPPDVLLGLDYLGVSVPMDEYELNYLGKVLSRPNTLKTLVLRELVYVREWLVGVLACVPGLERLGLRWRDPNPGQTADMMQEEPLPLSELLCLVPKLTHLSTVYTAFWKAALEEGVTDHSRADAQDNPTGQNVDQTLAAVLWVLCLLAPSLTHVEFTTYEDRGRVSNRQWICVKRSGDGDFTGYTEMNEGVESIEHWSGCYFSEGRSLKNLTWMERHPSST